MGEHMTFQTGEATTAAYLALPESGRGPGVLVLHAWWGLTATFTEVCDRLARAGFVAFAPDLNAGQAAATVDDAMALMKSRNWDVTQAAAVGGLEYLLAHPARTGQQIGMVGFSMGAAWTVALASKHPEVSAAVLFYGTGSADFAAARAAYLAHFAENDPWEEDAEVQAMLAAMREAGREVTDHAYPGASHWFFEPDRPEYDRAAAELAWERSLAFLQARLGDALAAS
ncbi:MAG TPA: dienelactone hydrolase family protein [Herpetosiphonaceae bacterium]|nr:dienelactone hydrolase family protein [Herpetosiphonaceae bacterium]